MAATATIQLTLRLVTGDSIETTIGEGRVKMLVPASLDMDETGTSPTISVDFSADEVVERLKAAVNAFELSLMLTAPQVEQQEIPDAFTKDH